MKHKSTTKRKFRLNTPKEEARIQDAIKADPDTRELSAKAQMRPFTEMIRQRGRPRSAVHKEPVTVRLDPEIVTFFRAGGAGWQTRMNEALSEYVNKRRRPRS